MFNNIVVWAGRGLWYVLPKPQPNGAVGVLSLLSDFNVLYSCGRGIVAAGNAQLPGWIHAGLQYDCETRTTDPGLRDPAAGTLNPRQIRLSTGLLVSPTPQRGNWSAGTGQISALSKYADLTGPAARITTHSLSFSRSRGTCAIPKTGAK